MGQKTVGRFTTDVTTPVAVAANSNIIFTTSTVSTNAISYNSTTGEIEIKAPGLYMIFANFTPIATAVGQASVQVFEDGIAIPGAKSTTNLAAVGNAGTLSFNAITTVRCSAANDFATLTFRNINATSYSVENVIIEKIA